MTAKLLKTRTLKNALAISLIATILFLTFIAEYFITLGPMVIGRIDYVLLSRPCCHHTTPHINGHLVTTKQLGPFDYILWKSMKMFLTRYNSPACDSVVGISSECRQSIDKEYCKLCKSYQQYRCHFRADELLLRRSPWRNEGQMLNMSIHSGEDCHVSFPTDKVEKKALANIIFKDEPTNVLHTAVVDRKHAYSNAYFSTDLDPQPALEISVLESNWHSVFQPVVDVNISGVVAHFVVGYGRVPINSLGMSIPLPMPMVWIGNSTLEQVMDMIPPTPTKEGLYPRLGIVNITNVSILIHDLINDSRKVVGDPPISEIVIPDEIFLPLLQVTIDAGKEGIDQIEMSSLLKETLIMIIRKHVLGEDKIRASFDKPGEILNAVKGFIIDIIQKRSNVVNDHLDKATNKVKEVIQNVEKEWKNVVRDEKQVWKPFFEDMKEDWDEIKRVMKDNDEHDSIFMDSVEKEIEKNLENVREEVKQGWEEAKYKLFDKVNEINDGLKKSQAKAQDSVEPIVSVIGEAFFGNVF